MKEIDFLKQKNILITQKQFRIIIIKMCVIFLITMIITIVGILLMVITSKAELFYIGLALFVGGGILFVIDFFFIMIRYSAKVQFYLHYKKYPEDFDNDI